ncbi:MAG: M23 family metallopeptidase [Bacteroidales bacterium]|nr:M23 family metallopeptidase [Bacteroidales bacterium]
MAKHKYKFNPDSLSYTKVARSSKGKAMVFFTYFFASIVLALIYFLIFNAAGFKTPNERKLVRENSSLKENIHFITNDVSQLEEVLQDLQDRDDNIYRTIFEAEPIHFNLRESGSGGADRYKDLQQMENAELVINIKSRLDKISNKIYVQSKSYDEIMELAKNKEAMLASIPAIQPISNKDLKRTASGWGYRIHPIYKIRKFHYGMDFTAPRGAEIYATGDGVIESLTSSKRGYGNKIILNHGYGYKTLYAHCDRFNAEQGQQVKRGDVIGYVGSSGLSTAPHLHYEVLINGKQVNPIDYYHEDLNPEEYERMIEISLSSGQTFD